MITSLANALACRMDDQSLGLLSAMLVQLGDTLATISVQRSLCENRRLPTCGKSEKGS